MTPSTFLCGAALLLAGCASVPMGDPAQDRALKTFAAPGGHAAGLYVYRNPGEAAGKPMQIQVDGVDIGQTDAGTYLYTPLAPGRHRVRSQAESMDRLDVDAAAGQLVFVHQSVRPGLFDPDAKLHLVAEDEGRRGVLASRLAFVGALPDGAHSGRSASAVVPLAVPAPRPVPQSMPPVAAAPTSAPSGQPAHSSSPRHLGDDSALPYVSAHGRADYRSWLSWNRPRAFAIAPNGAWYAAQGTVATNKLPSDPAQRALTLCQQRAGMPCALYAVDDRLVWDRTPKKALP